MKKKKKMYITPLLCVAEFKMEKGYASSNLDLNDKSIEKRQNGGNWGGSDSWY